MLSPARLARSLDSTSLDDSRLDAVAPTSRVTNPASVHPSGVKAPQRDPARLRGFGKVALGGIIAGVFGTYYTTLETVCANNIDPYAGAGELVITQGGSSTRFPAPLNINAGAKLSANGTIEAQLLWIENLCDDVLDCSTCPFELNSHFNASTLNGKILLHDFESCAAIYLCGWNRLGRTFGRTGLVGLGAVQRGVSTRAYAPGFWSKVYRLGEHRDVDGIPFPHFHVSRFLLDSGILKETRAVLTPTALNPWREMACGYWKPLSTLLMLGHVGIVERAASNWIGHIRTSGLRLDLAQLALATESLAHSCMSLLHHDPYLAFHWGVFPVGAFASFVCGSIVLTCSSTLLLAGFWCVYSFSNQQRGAGGDD